MAGFKKGKLLGGAPISMRQSRASGKLRFLLWMALFGAVALLAWCGSLYYAITQFEGVPKDEPVRADVGIVLGARLWNDEPSPGLRERLNHSLALYRAGAFDNFIVTGGLDDGGATITEAEGMRDYLVKQGVPEQAIQMDSLSRSTYENLAFAQEIMDREDWHTAVIMTHRYHGSRTANIAGHLGFSPVQVSVTDSQVLQMSYHEMREILAYTKWLATKLFL